VFLCSVGTAVLMIMGGGFFFVIPGYIKLIDYHRNQIKQQIHMKVLEDEVDDFRE